MTTKTNQRRFALLLHKRLPERIWHYLIEKKGLSREVVHRYLLGWNGSRITIPIANRDGEVVFFRLARDPEEKDPRSPEILYSPSLELYGWDTIEREPARLVLCEGEFNRLLLESWRIPAAASTGGALAFKEEWIERLKSVPELFICFNRDEAGRRGALGLCRLLPRAKVIHLPPEVGGGGGVSDFFLKLGKDRADFEELLFRASRPMELKLSPELPPDLAQRLAHIRAGLSIVQVVGREVDLRRDGKRHLGLCPFHDDEYPSLVVFPKNGRFRCMVCRAEGDAVEFVRRRQGLSFSGALSYLESLLP